MKQNLSIILFLLFYSNIAVSQIENEKYNGLFYKIALATTLSINEEYEVFDDSDETLFNPSALYINNTLGYQFDMRTSIGLNLGYN